MLFQISTSIPMILVINKIDCASSACSTWVDREAKSFSKHVFTCAITGQGIPDLEKSISEIVGLNQIPAGGRRWTVNQVSILNCLLGFFFCCFYCNHSFILISLTQESRVLIPIAALYHSLLLTLTAPCEIFFCNFSEAMRTAHACKGGFC